MCQIDSRNCANKKVHGARSRGQRTDSAMEILKFVFPTVTLVIVTSMQSIGYWIAYTASIVGVTSTFKRSQFLLESSKLAEMNAAVGRWVSTYSVET